VSLWLNSRVPATEVARQAGHGVAVLLKISAHRIDGQADAANKRITDALGAQDAEPAPGGERYRPSCCGVHGRIADGNRGQGAVCVAAR
jgi:hypothetical protein